MPSSATRPLLALMTPANLAGLLLSSLVGYTLYAGIARTIESDSAERFDGMARNAQYTINARIKSYTDVLRGTASLFRTNGEITREQFHAYVEGLSMQENFPGIEVINFARSVSDADRPAFEQAERHARQVSGLAGSFQIKPSGRRPYYTVITFIEPPQVWDDKMGYDLTSRDHVERNLAESRDTGQVSASGTRVAVLSGPNKHGLGMRLPVYRNGMPTSTVDERRAAYVGTVGIGFGVSRLVQGVLHEIPVAGTRLTITDLVPLPREVGEPEALTVLFDSDATMANPAPPIHRENPGRFHASLPIGFNHRNWVADFSIAKGAMYSRFDAYSPWLGMFGGFTGTWLLYALFRTMANARQRAVNIAEEMTRELRASKLQLQTSHQTLRQLAAHADQIKERERKRIAREIHDDLGQNLLALRIDADMLAARTGERHPRLHARARSTRDQIDATIRSVRQIINDLRPNVLDLGLNAAVDWQVQEFERRTGLRCEVVENAPELPIDDDCATALFRILQESLSNIARHAHASHVRIELHFDGAMLTMRVIDNGIGVGREARGKVGSFGLVGIEERINLLGGLFVIDSAPQGGTSVMVRVPVQRAPARRDTDKEGIAESSLSEVA